MPHISELEYRENEQQNDKRIMQQISDFWGYIWVMFVAFIGSLKKQEIQLNNRKLIVKKKLGEGGYSFVYLVKDKVTLREFALKIIQCEMADQVKMLDAEIQAHGKVNSDFVLPLIDSKVIPGLHTKGYLLLPFYGNGTVQDMIDTKSKIPLKVIAKIAIDVCSGLAAFQ